jgi:hypothetical protein
MAILDVAAAKITAIFPAGFKNHALAQNPLDPSDKDGGANIKSWPVFGKFQADEIKAFSDRGVDYIVAANEGDERDWPGAVASSTACAVAIIDFMFLVWASSFFLLTGALITLWRQTRVMSLTGQVRSPTECSPEGHRRQARPSCLP